MAEKWHAEIEITELLVKSCLKKQFYDFLSVESIKKIGSGWDNDVFLVNDCFVFRFPRREVAVELITNENKVLKNLEGRFDLEIPKPIFIGTPSVDYPYPFQGYEIIKGVSACHAHLSDQQREESLKKVSIFLKTLHSIEESEARSLGASYQVFDRTIEDRVIETLLERVRKIDERKVIKINFVEIQKEIDAIKRTNFSHRKCLVHGDLYCRHLMFDKGELIGIIDWGDLGINDPSIDLSLIWSFYPQSAHEEFFDIYGPVDESSWRYARFLGLYSALTIILYGHDVGDILLVKEGKESVMRINPLLIIEDRF